MKNLILKECKIYFRSPGLYIIAALFSAFAGILYYTLLNNYIMNIQDQLIRDQSMNNANQSLAQLAQGLIFPLIGNCNFLLMLIVPAIVMNSFSEEYRRNTFMLYQLSFQSIWKVILAKFLAGFLVVLFILSTLIFYPILLWQAGIYEYSFLFTGFFGLILNSLFYLSIGIWASSITNHMMLSLFLTYAILFIQFFLSSLATITKDIFFLNLFQYISFSNHFEQISKGDITTSDVFFYFIFIFFFLYLTRKQLALREQVY